MVKVEVAALPLRLLLVLLLLLPEMTRTTTAAGGLEEEQQRELQRPRKQPRPLHRENELFFIFFSLFFHFC